jgi:hypothetical protein
LHIAGGAVTGGAFEGDLIRPLGQLTLYFGYAEVGIDALLNELKDVGLLGATPTSTPLGQKLAVICDTLARLQMPEADDVVSIIDEGRPLIELRNVLVHSAILTKGRVVPSDKSQPVRVVTPGQLTDLAEAIFTWKERLNAACQLQLIPALRRLTGSDS